MMSLGAAMMQAEKIKKGAINSTFHLSKLSLFYFLQGGRDQGSFLLLLFSLETDPFLLFVKQQVQ
jgi:hypothetical protein